MTKTARNELNQYKCSINKMIALNNWYLNVRHRKAMRKIGFKGCSDKMISQLSASTGILIELLTMDISKSSYHSKIIDKLIAGGNDTITINKPASVGKSTGEIDILIINSIKQHEYQ